MCYQAGLGTLFSQVPLLSPGGGAEQNIRLRYKLLNFEKKTRAMEGKN